MRSQRFISPLELSSRRKMRTKVVITVHFQILRVSSLLAHDPPPPPPFSPDGAQSFDLPLKWHHCQDSALCKCAFRWRLGTSPSPSSRTEEQLLEVISATPDTNTGLNISLSFRNLAGLWTIFTLIKVKRAKNGTTLLFIPLWIPTKVNKTVISSQPGRFCRQSLHLLALYNIYSNAYWGCFFLCKSCWILQFFTNFDLTLSDCIWVDVNNFTFHCKQEVCSQAKVTPACSPALTSEFASSFPSCPCKTQRRASLSTFPRWFFFFF